MLGRDVSERLDCEDGNGPFAHVAPWLGTADMTLGNLECVITARDIPQPGPYHLLAPPSAVTALRDAGFDALGLANNHALDAGAEGLAETVARLRAVGIATLAGRPDRASLAEPLLRQIGGVRLALLAFNAVPLPPTRGTTDEERKQLLASIAAAHAQADAVIVSVHWGYEYELRADPAQVRLGQAMLAAGADLVVGHHPHVVQGTQVSAGHFIAYSLGNFVFDQQQGATQQGLALRAFFDKNGLRAVQAVPVWAGPQPRLMAPAEAASLLARVQPPPRRLGFACQALDRRDGEACREVEVSQATRSGPFHAGAIDLTGDGLPELVRLQQEQVVVYAGGREIWRGLPQWRVVDIALGDPNDDGRGELLVALWKADMDGVPRSHPFIIGYRQGAYRVLWGGSAVTYPIREVELGDVDGDGVQELIVLEDMGEDCTPAGATAVSVWRWHGWGFTLAWRSPPGCYRDLALLPGEAGSPAIVSVAEE